MRRTVVVIATALLVLVGLQPASAASAPAKVGLVSFVAADYTRASDTGVLKLDWPDARRAKKYQVFMSRSYSMSKAKTFTVRSSQITVKGLARGRDYFFQVRGVNGKKHGSKSSRVGHTTIVRPGPDQSQGLAIRVMTYNVCSDVCDVKKTTAHPWVRTSPEQPSARQPRAMERIAAARPDVLATQEAGKMDTPEGYTLAMDVSAKRLYYRTARFDVAEGAPYLPGEKDKHGCRASTAFDAQKGHVLLGYHGGKCRYAAWAELVDKVTQKHVVVADVHTVTGTSSKPVSQRAQEMATLMSAMAQVKARGVPVVFAGDFNSHKNRGNDVVGKAMKSAGYTDAYDLARTLVRQHVNSYNGFSTKPRISYKWGDHVDHVFVSAWTSRVDAWRNIVLIGADGKMVKTIPSDHSPLVVDVRIS